MNIQFRKAEASDITDIVALVNLTFRGDTAKLGWTHEADLLDGKRTDENEIAEILRSHTSALLLATYHDQIIGCVCIERSDVDTSECFLGMLTVNPNLQTAGLGKEILAYAEKFAQKTFQTQTMSMSVIVQRPELIAWYERRGYQKTDQQKPYEGLGLPKQADVTFQYFKKSLT